MLKLRNSPTLPRTGFALAAVCLGSFMTLLDGSAVNIALPAIQHDLHGSIAAVQWVVNIYTIPLASLLLTVGNLGDRLGLRRLFIWSLTLFILASVLCATSPTLGFLLGARVLQGIAAGGLLPTTLAIIARTYSDPVERAKAITVWGATGAVALVVGPIVGGVLTDVLGWRSIFMVNVPVGLATVATAIRYMQEAPHRRTQSADVPGQIAGIVALGALVGGLIEGGAGGWTSAATLGLLVLAAGCAAAFVAIEHRSKHPAVPPSIFRRHAFTALIASGLAYQFGSFGMQFMLAIYLQEQWHLTAAHTGLLFLPFSCSSVFGIIVLNRRLVHRGPRWLLWTGSATSSFGALCMLGVSDQSTWPLLVVGTTLVGLGCGVFAPSINAAAMLSIEPEYSGLGSAVLNTARQIGIAIGVALFGAFISLHDALLGMRICMGLAALCFLMIVLLSLRYVPRQEQCPTGPRWRVPA